MPAPRTTASAAATRADKELLLKGVTCTLIGLVILLAPYLARSGSVREMMAQATVVGWCSERLARFKVPADIAIIDALPRNATGKVLKRELRTRFVGSNAPAIT